MECVLLLNFVLDLKNIFCYWQDLENYRPVTAIGFEPLTTLFLKNTQPFSQTGWMIELCCECLFVWCIWLYVIIMSCTHFRVNLHSSCLNTKELLAWNRHGIWSSSDSNWIQAHNHLVCKQILNHLAKLAKWLSCFVGTYLYSVFDSMLSCLVHV